MVRTRRSKIRNKIKKLKKKKKRLRLKLSEYNLEDFIVYKSWRRLDPFLVFDRGAGGISDESILTPAELMHALRCVKCNTMKILYEEDREIFDNFEDFRKYILIKKLSGIL